MEMYVDELPKSCRDCPMCRSGKLKLQRKGRYVEAEQCVLGGYKYQSIDDEINTCPLKSIAEHDKQVRKDLIGNFKEELKKYGKCSIRKIGTMDFYIEMDKLNEILDKAQGEKE